MHTPGSGFPEKVYENALARELRKKPAPAQAAAALSIAQQHKIAVRYDDGNGGDHAAYLLAEATILMELKTVKALDHVHTAPCINDLRA